MLKRLLELTYARELELEDIIERSPNRDLKWFFRDTKQVNIDLQIKCLDKLEKTRLIEEERSKLH